MDMRKSPRRRVLDSGKGGISSSVQPGVTPWQCSKSYPCGRSRFVNHGLRVVGIEGMNYAAAGYCSELLFDAFEMGCLPKSPLSSMIRLFHEPPQHALSEAGFPHWPKRLHHHTYHLPAYQENNGIFISCMTRCQGDAITSLSLAYPESETRYESVKEKKVWFHFSDHSPRDPGYAAPYNGWFRVQLRSERVTFNSG